MTASTNLDQQRAAFAWQCISADLQKDYKVLAKSAPALILNNGLMQTLAYYEDKKGTAKMLQQHICHWLENKDVLPGTEYPLVMQTLHQSSSAQYRRATDESIKFLRWIRQFATTNIQGD